MTKVTNRILWLDFETRSPIDLKATGLDVYMRSHLTEILMLAWAINDGDVNLWVPIRGEEIPQ